MNNFNIETNELYSGLKYMRDAGYLFQHAQDEEANGRTVQINNKELVHFASCSYLGLEKHPALIKGAADALQRFGTQTPSSRAIVSSPMYKELEGYLEEMFPGNTLVAQTVTLAHCSVLPLLVGDKDAVILDAFVHNSVRMASSICKANGTFITVTKHNDMKYLEYLIYRLKKDGYRNIWYCADGLYSIHGDLCDVAGLKTLLDKEDNFYAYVDDAHGTGWCGKNGSGYVLGNFGLHDKMIVAESFAKSMVTSGGGIVIPDLMITDFIRLAGQTMIFSGPIQPSTMGALVACVKLHLSEEIVQYQNEIVDKIEYFNKKCIQLNLPLASDDITPVKLIRIGDVKKTHKVLSDLHDRGYLASTVMFPAVRHEDTGIRVTITRHILNSDIDGLLGSIKQTFGSKEFENINTEKVEPVNV